MRYSWLTPWSWPTWPQSEGQDGCASVFSREHRSPHCRGFSGRKGFRAHQFDALQTLSAHDLREFQPTYEEASQYFNPAMMPGRSKNLDKSTIIKYRLPNLWSALPTFMAKYGEQHLLPAASLAAKGLFGFFARQGATFRFFTPVEICLLHAHWGAVILLKPKRVSYEHLGNKITILHSLSVLVPALQLFGFLDPASTYLHDSGDRRSVCMVHWLL